MNCPIAPSTSVGCEPWVPAGPAVNIFLSTSYKGAVDEFITGLQGGQIDAVDETLTPSEVSSLGGASCPTANPVVFYCTLPIVEYGYSGIAFNLAGNLWGIPLSFGNSAKGIEVRQGIAHLMDKIQFALNDPFCAGKCIPIDNPLPPCGFSFATSSGPTCVNGGASNPDPCGWDPQFNEATIGTPGICEVGAPGGTAYHLAQGQGTTCGRAYSYYQCPGSSDFCAAAIHFWDVGLASGPKPGSVGGDSCILNANGRSLNSTATGNIIFPGLPVTFYVSTDSPLLHDLGIAETSLIRTLFNGPGSYPGQTVNPCNEIDLSEQTSASFPIFLTQGGAAGAQWGMATLSFPRASPFDQSLYYGFNSVFAAQPSGFPCATTRPAPFASNFVFMCVPGYDSAATQMEFASAISLGDPNCISPTGQDPIVGRSAPTFGYCNNSSGRSVLDSVSAAYEAQDLFGQGAYMIPMLTSIDTFAYTRNFPAPGAVTPNAANFENEQGGPLTGLPGFPNWMNAWCQAGVPQSSSTCSVANTAGTAVSILRQGFAQPTASINPYIARNPWDLIILGNVYDSLGFVNPMQSQPLALYDWMTSNSRFITSAGLGYTPSCLELFGSKAGTDSSANCLTNNGAFRLSLRSDNVWQDGQPVTSWDVRFSYLSLNQTGSFQGAGLSPLNDVHVLSKFQFDLDIKAQGPFTQLFLMGPTIIPGNYWSACGVLGSNTWNSDVAAGSVPDACMQPASGALSVNFDPMTQVNPTTGATGIVVGSGAWTCQSMIGVLGGGCSSSGTEVPGTGGTWTLTRNGCTASSSGTTCFAPGHSQYFRASGSLAMFLWATSGAGSTAAAKLSGFLYCYGPVKPGCGHYEEGIGNPSTSTTTCPCSVGVFQQSEFDRYVFSVGIWLPVAGNGGVGDFTTYTGVAVSPPILYEGVSTLNPARLVGCTFSTPSTPAYPNGGGYDC